MLTTPVPPSFEVGALVVLLSTPAAVPVTFTVIVHELPERSEPLLKLSDVSPAVGIEVPVQVPPIPVGLATCMPLGKLSKTPTPVSAVPVFGLVRVRVRVETPPSGMLVGLNDLVMVGGTTTVIEAEAVLPMPP